MTAPPPLSTADVRVFLEVAAGAVQSTRPRARLLHTINQVAPHLLLSGHAIGEYRLSELGQVVADRLALESRTPIGFPGDEFIHFDDGVLLNANAMNRYRRCGFCGADVGSRCVRRSGKNAGQPLLTFIHQPRAVVYQDSRSVRNESQRRCLAAFTEPFPSRLSWHQAQQVVGKHRRMVRMSRPTPTQPAALQADQLVAKAECEGKLSRAQRDWFRHYALSDIDAATEWLKTAPKVVPGGAKRAPLIVLQQDLPEPFRRLLVSSEGV